MAVLHKIKATAQACTRGSFSLLAAAAMVFAAGTSAQNLDTAYVPFRVNVDATATAQLAGGEKFEKLVRAGSTDTLHIISESTTPVISGKTPRPVAMHISRGKISLELSRQLYKGVDIALYSLNGKQIMHARADASETIKSISHPNIRMGVYVLSVKGVGGSIFTTRLTHSGGGMNIDVSLANENFSSASLMEKSLPGNWTITVSAEGHLDTSYAFVPEIGRGNTLVQNITLRQLSSPSSSSVEVVPSSSSAEYESSSSSTEGEPSSSSSAPSSSSSVIPVTLACGSMPASGFSDVAIALPVLTCSNGETPADTDWSENAPDWSSPATGTYSGISVTATCGTSSDLTANCNGTLTVEPVLACGSVPASGVSGVEISTPVLNCKNEETATYVIWSANAPNWSEPASGTYSDISVTATCGTATKTANCGGSLTVDPVTLTCGTMPASGISDVAINPPLTCNNDETPANTVWSESAPDWNSPVRGTYSDISVTADCGTSSGLTANCNGSLQVYKTVVIGSQTWMAENLNYNPGTGTSACYNNQANNCTTYGRLYNWATAMGLASSCNSSSCSNQIRAKHRGICPAGWHIPSNAEWTTLTDYVGSSTAGTKLKAVSGWSSTSGTDEYGFSALPGGYGKDGSFYNVGNNGLWWSATEVRASVAYRQYMDYSFIHVASINGDKSILYSVRCIQD